MSSTNNSSTVNAPTHVLEVKGNAYAYRRFGMGSRPPLLFLQHFTGTLDNCDPAVTDPLAAGREVILFDNAGVGRSGGQGLHGPPRSTISTGTLSLGAGRGGFKNDIAGGCGFSF
jgi:pimeloyl-ACP methyl ester carboxylesterase